MANSLGDQQTSPDYRQCSLPARGSCIFLPVVQGLFSAAFRDRFEVDLGLGTRKRPAIHEILGAVVEPAQR
jgi:hypothetical protein